MAAKKGKLGRSLLKDIEGDKKPRNGKQPAPPAKPQSKHPLIPGGDLLGRGYNVVKQAYASADPPMPNLFDFSAEGTVDQQIYDASLPQVRENVENAFTAMPPELKLMYARWPGVQFTELYEATLEFSRGESLSDQQRTLAVNVGIDGNYGLFAAEFSARYTSSDSHLSTHKFYSVTAKISYYDLSMANYSLRPVDLLRPQVRKDLNDASLSADEIFDTYGTHYLSAVTIGSKIVYGHTIDTSKTTSSYDAEAELKARYGGEEAGIGVSGGTNVSGASEQAADAEEVTFYAKGISDAQVEAAESADTKPLALLKEAWHNPTLIDVPAGGLKPIWNLCDSADRRDELQSAFAAYAKAHGSFVGAEANLTPLYLCNHPQHPTCYLLSQNRTGRTVDGTTWKEATGDAEAKPWLLVFDAQQPDTVPLYEYAFAGDDSGTWRRYETSRWDSWLTFVGWKKTSGNPVGWVYDGLVPAPAASTADIYVYASEGPFWLYSADSAEGRDKGCWQPATQQLDLELWMIWMAKSNRMDQASSAKPDADALAVQAVKSNVHWRAPTS